MSRELTALGQRYYGVYLGTVIAVDDEDGLGRVRIENDQYEDTDDDPTWAAVVRPLAGDVTSVYFSPKPGDQVVFTFVAGDVRQPIVLGYAHTTERKPESPSGTKQKIAVKNVGTLTFDEDGGGAIEVEHKNGARLRMTDSSIEMQFQGSVVRLNAAGVEIVGTTVKLGNTTLAPGLQGVLTGETVDTLTGTPFAALGQASLKVLAVNKG